MKIKLEDYVQYAQSLHGLTRKTLAEGKEFRIEAFHDRVRFFPKSTGKPRGTTTLKQIGQILAHYEKTGSHKTSEYQEITRNASYHLAVIADYVATQKVDKAE